LRYPTQDSDLKSQIPVKFPMQMQQETNEGTNKLCLPMNRCDNGPEWPATSRPKPIQAGHKKATKINTELQRERQKYNKNSSGDEIENVNLFTTISHTYFEIPKRVPTSFSKLNGS